jgi:flagellar biosynthesis protein FlhG
MIDQAFKLRELASNERRHHLGERKRLTRRISVTSGKGGVGKSNFALNFAILASQLGKKTLLIDADTNLANIDILLGITPQFNLSHVIAGMKSAREVLIKGPNGIDILPASSGNLEQVLHDTAASQAVISDLDTLENDYELVVLDTGAGASRNVLDFVLYSDIMVLVTTPEPTAITDAYALIKLVTQERGDIDIQILVNLAHTKQEAMEVFEKLSAVVTHFLNLEVSFLGYLPRDIAVERAVQMQAPLVPTFPKSSIATQLKFIARRLLLSGNLPAEENLSLFAGLFRRG